jgi:hypothetical protein
MIFMAKANGRELAVESLRGVEENSHREHIVNSHKEHKEHREGDGGNGLYGLYDLYG